MTLGSFGGGGGVRQKTRVPVCVFVVFFIGYDLLRCFAPSYRGCDVSYCTPFGLALVLWEGIPAFDNYFMRSQINYIKA